MEDNRKDLLIVDTEELEDRCIVLRSRTAYVYCYPFCKEVWKTGAKIVTRSGQTVKKVQIGSSNGEEVIVGILGGQELKWDAAGRYKSPYIDDENDLMIYERYFYKDWKSHIKLSHADWELRFGRPHPTVKIPTDD